MGDTPELVAQQEKEVVGDAIVDEEITDCHKSSESNSSTDMESYSDREAKPLTAERDHAVNNLPASEDAIRISSLNHKVFKYRWLLMAALFWISLSNGMMWLTYAPVPNISASFYRITVSDVDWFSNVYFIASLVMGFFSIWVLDKFGLRAAVLTGAALNLVGAVIRFLSSIQPILCAPSHAGFGIAIFGQMLTAFAQPFFLYAPTTLANTWFKPDERSLCTGITSLANPLGIAITQLVTPHVVHHTADIRTLLWINIIPVAIGAIVSLLFIRNKPPVPPASSGDVADVAFFKGLKMTVTNLNFLVLLAVWGLAAGGVNAFLIMVPQYLCPYGYSNEDVGLWASLLIFFGLIGATIAGLVIDKTKLFKEVGVVVYSLSMLCLIVFMNVAGYPNLPIPIAASLSLFGLFGFAFLPVCLELGVEVTYPVAEATSSGLLWSVAQVTGMLMLLITSSVLTVPIATNDYTVCGVGVAANNTLCPGNNTSTFTHAPTLDWTYAGLFVAVSSIIGFLLFVVFFKPTYKRLIFEKKMASVNR